MYRSPWSAAGETVGNALTQIGSYFLQKQANQGQMAQQQVQEYVSQAELALADANYKWKPGEREAAEAFVTQAKNITRADPLQAAGMWEDLQKRGIKVRTTTPVGAQGSAENAGATTSTLKPYGGNGQIANFFGDVNAGVTQAGQEREQFELDLANLRELKQMGRAQEYNVALKNMERDYGEDMLASEQAFTAEQAQTQLDAAGSAAAREGIVSALNAIGDISDPKNKAAVDNIMAEAKASGLKSWDLVQVQAARQGLGSAAAELGWEDRLQQSAQGKLTTAQMQNTLNLGRQQVVINGQTIQLGEFMREEQEYIAKRRPIEDSLADRATMEETIATAVANGDDKEINNLINILEGGGAVSPDIYAALTNAGITAQTLQENYGDALDSDAWRTKKTALDMTEMSLAETQLFRADKQDAIALASAEGAYADQVAASMSPREIDAALKDPNSSLYRLYNAGLVSDSSLKTMKRNAGFHLALRADEVAAPKIERNMGLLEKLAAVPANPEIAKNSLNATMSELVQLGAISEDQVPGLVSMYEEGWDYGKQVQDEELLGMQSSRRYTAVMRAVQERALNTKAVEGGLEASLPDWDAVREGFNDDLDALQAESDQLGCGSAEFITNAMPEEKQACQNIGAEMAQMRLERREVNRNYLGVLAPAEQEMALADLGDRVYQATQNDPALRGASPEQIEHEATRRLAIRHGIGEDPGPWQEPVAEQPRQGRPGTGTLAGDVGAAGRELGGTIRQQGGEIVGAANAFQDYVLGNPRGAATPAQTPATAPQQGVGPSVGAGTAAKLNAIPEFGQLVEGIASGSINTRAQLAAAEALGAANGLTTTAVLELAQQQAFAANPPGYRTPWSGQ
jgi:hypothetical protein